MTTLDVTVWSIAAYLVIGIVVSKAFMKEANKSAQEKIEADRSEVVDALSLRGISIEGVIFMISSLMWPYMAWCGIVRAALYVKDWVTDLFQDDEDVLIEFLNTVETVDDLESAMNSVIEQVKADGISGEELEAITQQLNRLKSGLAAALTRQCTCKGCTKN